MRLLLCAVVALACAMVLAGPAWAETVAFVRGGSVYETELGGVPRLVDGAGGAVDVAYGSDGTLYVTRPEAGGEGCVLFRAGDGAPLVRFSELAEQTGTFSGLCAIDRDPGGGLLMGAHNGPLASAQVFRLELPSRRVARVAYGYAPAASPDGRRLVLVQHRYFRGSGSYETLAMGRPGELSSFRRIVPIASRTFGPVYAAPSFAPDGRIAAVRQPYASARDPRNQLVVGKPGGRLRAVWRASAQREITQTAWSSDGASVYALVAGRSRERATIIGVSTSSGARAVLLRNVATFAVREGGDA